MKRPNPKRERKPEPDEPVRHEVLRRLEKILETPPWHVEPLPPWWQQVKLIVRVPVVR